ERPGLAAARRVHLDGVIGDLLVIHAREIIVGPAVMAPVLKAELVELAFRAVAIGSLVEAGVVAAIPIAAGLGLDFLLGGAAAGFDAHGIENLGFGIDGHREVLTFYRFAGLVNQGPVIIYGFGSDCPDQNHHFVAHGELTHERSRPDRRNP